MLLCTKRYLRVVNLTYSKGISALAKWENLYTQRRYLVDCSQLAKQIDFPIASQYIPYCGQEDTFITNSVLYTIIMHCVALSH